MSRKRLKNYVVHWSTLLLVILPRLATSDSLSNPLGGIKSQGNRTSNVVRKMFRIPIYSQQDPALHSLFISGNCCTCFGWYLHPSSGAQTTVSTAFFTATVRYRGRRGTSSISSTIADGSSNGLTSNRCCRYSCVCSWWWVESSPETCTEVYRYK